MLKCEENSPSVSCFDLALSSALRARGSLHYLLSYMVISSVLQAGFSDSLRCWEGGQSNCLLCWWLWCCHGKAPDFRGVCVLLGAMPSFCDLLQHREWAGVCRAASYVVALKGRVALITGLLRDGCLLYLGSEVINRSSTVIIYRFGILVLEENQVNSVCSLPLKSKNVCALHMKKSCEECHALR